MHRQGRLEPRAPDFKGALKITFWDKKDPNFFFVMEMLRVCLLIQAFNTCRGPRNEISLGPQKFLRRPCTLFKCIFLQCETTLSNHLACTFSHQLKCSCIFFLQKPRKKWSKSVPCLSLITVLRGQFHPTLYRVFEISLPNNHLDSLI